MWTICDGPNVYKATDKLVAEFYTMAPCPQDRPLKPVLLKILTDIANAGKLRSPEWASAYCEQTKTEYRVNGKHTSTVFTNIAPRHRDYRVIVTRYHCPTLEDVAKLYATFDPRFSARTSGDINRAYAASHPDLEPISGNIINLCVAGLAYNIHEDAYARGTTQEERAEAMLRNVDFIIWVNNLLHNSEATHLKRMAVVAAMVRTSFKVQKASMEFWNLVRDGSGPDHRSADRTLNKFLLRSTVRSSSLGSSARSFSQREFFVKCIHGWNAWRKGETTNLNYYPTAATPAAA